MNYTELNEKLLQVMSDTFGKLEGKEALLKEDGTRLADDLQLDSFDLITLQVQLEENFDFEFDPLEDNFVEIFECIGKLKDFIKKKCEAEA